MRLFEEMIRRPMMAFVSGMGVLGENIDGMQRVDGMVSRIVHTLSSAQGRPCCLDSEATSAGQHTAATMTDYDCAILESVEKTLADGVALKEWWEQKDSDDSYAKRFEVVREFNQSSASFGFFDQVSLESRTVPVMGTVDDLLYDQPKQASSEKVRDEFRQFVLHYLMRVSSYRQPEAYVENGRDAEPAYLPGISWCTRSEGSRIGFGFSQHYYKLRDSGVIGKFREQDEFAIVDLREISEKYDWVVLKVRIFDFNLTLRLFGSDNARVLVPLSEESYLVVSRDFILDEDNPEPGVLGRYGFGYSFIKSPQAGLFAYGPGEFDIAIELINFRVLESGQTRATLVFVVNRPERILNISIKPVDWGFRLADLMSFGLASTLFAPVKSTIERLPLSLGRFDPVSAYVSLANQLTGGLAAEQFCISIEQLEKEFLVQHFMQHYQFIVGSLLTWRRIRDWLDRTQLPEWVMTGRTA